MAATDVLKNFRSKEYGSSPNKEGMDSGEPDQKTRIISLTDDEKKSFAQAKPGDDLACEVHGNLEEDGHFHVMSVAPLGGASSYGDENQGDEAKMAGLVAQRVQPNIAPSPS